MDILIYFLVILASGFSLSTATAWLSGYATRHKVLGRRVNGKRDRVFENLMLVLGIIIGAFCGITVTSIHGFWLKWAIVPLTAIGVPLAAVIIVFGGYYGMKALTRLLDAVYLWARGFGDDGDDGGNEKECVGGESRLDEGAPLARVKDVRGRRARLGPATEYLDKNRSLPRQD